VLQSEERKADAKDAMTSAAAAAGAVVVFAPLKDDEAARKLSAEAVKGGRKLAPGAAERLVAEAGTDWGVLSQELEKVLLYSKGAEVSVDDVLHCLGYQKAADPFALARLIQDRKLRESLSHLRRMMRDGKADDVAFRSLNQISSTVAKQLRARRMLTAGVPREQASRTLRLHPYWDRDYLDRVAKMAESRLARDLRRCVAAESDLKSKAWLDPRIEIERLIVDVCRA
jgi:DNA polymerase III delta subunit